MQVLYDNSIFLLSVDRVNSPKGGLPEFFSQNNAIVKPYPVKQLVVDWKIIFFETPDSKMAAYTNKGTTANAKI
jgi:hypothetical protein